MDALLLDGRRRCGRCFGADFYKNRGEFLGLVVLRGDRMASIRLLGSDEVANHQLNLIYNLLD